MGPKTGPKYTPNRILSCTRNLLYDNEIHYFGQILLQIKLNKDIKASALSIEGFALYPHEEEIILAPNVELLLEKKYLFWHT